MLPEFHSKTLVRNLVRREAILVVKVLRRCSSLAVFDLEARVLVLFISDQLYTRDEKKRHNSRMLQLSLWEMETEG